MATWLTMRSLALSLSLLALFSDRQRADGGRERVRHGRGQLRPHQADQQQGAAGCARAILSARRSSNATCAAAPHSTKCTIRDAMSQPRSHCTRAHHRQRQAPSSPFLDLLAHASDAALDFLVFALCHLHNFVQLVYLEIATKLLPTKKKNLFTKKNWHENIAALQLTDPDVRADCRSINFVFTA